MKDTILLVMGYMSLVLSFLMLVLSNPVRADEINNNCAYTVLDNWVLHKTEDTPNSKFQKNGIERQHLVKDLVEGSVVHDKRSFMPFLAVFFAYKESSFNELARGNITNGKAKAHGIMQFHNTIRMVCRRQLKLDLNQRYDQIVCFSYWIAHLSKKCGSLEGALRAYTSKGGSCKGTPKGRRLAKHRMRQVKKLASQCGVGVE
jgi:hypothetical protein